MDAFLRIAANWVALLHVGGKCIGATAENYICIPLPVVLQTHRSWLKKSASTQLSDINKIHIAVERVDSVDEQRITKKNYITKKLFQSVSLSVDQF